MSNKPGERLPCRHEQAFDKETAMTVNEYCRKTFGRKLYKIAIDAGFTCPNRDGTLDTRGCIFCSGRGSGDFAGNRNLSVTEQIKEGADRISGKAASRGLHPGGADYIAYFQAFTNTYAPTGKLREIYTEAADNPKIAAISIATRPDCLQDDVIALLRDINQIKPVWVELGLQTIHSDSAAYIRRGYDLPVYDSAVAKLAAAGIPQIITHVILGLPGETQGDMLETVRYVAGSGSNGIKLQLLHILRGTDLAKDYADGKFDVMDFETYTSLVAGCLRELPEDMVVHRVTGDGPAEDLIAPLWSRDKKRVLNTIHRKIREEHCGLCKGTGPQRF